MEKILELNNIYFKYNEKSSTILDNIDFKLNTGEIVLLAGPSGGGKSTFLKVCNGVITKEDGLNGNVYIDKESIENKKTSEVSKKIGTTFQNADEQIIFDKVEDELAFPCENLHYDRIRIKKEIKDKSEFMNLDLNSRTSILSGGEKQRLITASTLVMNQKVLIVDEPLANLDYSSGIKILEKLKFLCEIEGYSVIIIEHRLDLVLKYASRVLWLEEGKLKEFKEIESFIQFWENKILSIKNRDKKETSLIKIKDTNSLYIEDEIMNKEESNKPIIKLKNLNYEVKKKIILKNIDLSINEKNKYLLIGDNGSGKTTLMKSIARIIKTKEDYFEQDIVSKKDVGKTNWFRKVGYVFQNPNYQLYMSTVYDEINISSKSKEMTEKIIELFKFKDILNQHPHSLSEGQKRRVGVAAILAMDPEVLLLDEPTVGQDYNGLLMMIRALEKLDYKNKTIITITHDIRCADILGNKVIWLRDGSVYKLGELNLLNEYRNRKNIG